MSVKKLIVMSLLVIVAGVLTFMFWPSTKHPSNESAAGSSSQKDIQKKTTDTKLKKYPELTIGFKDARATLVEYGDFKCPECNKFYQGAEAELRQNYVDSGKLKIVFRNLPWIGPDSQRAAWGSYCANDQKAFKAYHDMLYEYMWDNYYKNGDFTAEHQDVFSGKKLHEIASNIGIDANKFDQCLNAQVFRGAVLADLQASDSDGASGTPFFVIGSQTITGVQPYDVFKTLVDIQLK